MQQGHSVLVINAALFSPSDSYHRKAKLIEDDEETPVETGPSMQPTVSWQTPQLLPERPDVTKAQLTSNEVALLNERMRSVLQAVYNSEYEVPSSPAPLSDVEQALDMTSQTSAVVQTIPFFVPQQQEVAPAVDTSPSYATNSIGIPAQTMNSLVYPQSTVATPEFVQALGLPMFLVGQDTQALQTLANSPSLLTTLIDVNGNYDQARLMSLVQTLSSTSGSQSQAAPAIGLPPSSYGGYDPTSASMMMSSHYGQPTSFPSSSGPSQNGFRSGSSEGNLHVSGYGPSTTEADIIALFSPYVRVDEIVMKGTFAFVNTSDPPNAERARELLNGTLLGGMPVRINPAQRKAKKDFGGPPSQMQSPMSGFGGQRGGMPPQSIGGPAMMGGAIPNVDSVKDDRGNPATKNLFVAGYGPGTTEEQVRDLFALHAEVVGVVLKGTFTFVNTADKSQAVAARQALSGTMLNGGVLRINFAKETGRLGTSFDLTYGKNTGPNAAPRRTSGASNDMSYYGRG